MEQIIKTVLLQDYPIHKLVDMNDELSMFSPSNSKCYSIKCKRLEEIDLKEFEGFDVICVLPEPWTYNIEVLKYIKEKTGLVMIGMFMQPVENLIYNQKIFTDSVPYFKLFDSVLCHNNAEVQLYSGLFGKKYTVIGSGVSTSSTIMNASKNQTIVSCSRFHWNNAYANSCVAREFKNLAYREYLSSNCNEKDREYAKQCYDLIGYAPSNVLFIPTRRGYLESLSRELVAVSLEWRHGIGRFLIDCALAGTPCICSSTLETSWIFEDITVEPFDIDEALNNVYKLRTDKDFYDLVVKTAFDNILYYDITQTTKRYNDLINSIRG